MYLMSKTNAMHSTPGSWSLRNDLLVSISRSLIASPDFARNQTMDARSHFHSLTRITIGTVAAVKDEM